MKAQIQWRINSARPDKSRDVRDRQIAKRRLMLCKQMDRPNSVRRRHDCIELLAAEVERPSPRVPRRVCPWPDVPAGLCKRLVDNFDGVVVGDDGLEDVAEAGHASAFLSTVLLPLQEDNVRPVLKGNELVGGEAVIGRSVFRTLALLGDNGSSIVHAHVEGISGRVADTLVMAPIHVRPADSEILTFGNRDPEIVVHLDHVELLPAWCAILWVVEVDFPATLCEFAVVDPLALLIQGFPGFLWTEVLDKTKAFSGCDFVGQSHAGLTSSVATEAVRARC